MAVAGNKIVISENQMHEVESAAARLRGFKSIKDDMTLGQIIDACDKQVHGTATWKDEDTGLEIPLACLIDLVPNLESDLAIGSEVFSRSAGDLKTTCNASLRAWENWAHKAGYEIQGAFNSDMLSALGRDVDRFLFLLSENMPPYQPGKRIMTFDPIEFTGDLDSGRRKYTRMLKNYCKCLSTGNWPSFDDVDTAGAGGWTEVRPNPFLEQEFMFEPKMEFEEENEEKIDIIP
jgi:hypothetical protein